MAQTTWTPNEKQTRFMEILKENPDGITLREIKSKYGIEFATGTFNSLLPHGKNKVKKADFTRDFTADIIYNGEKIGEKPYHDTVYLLVG
jgi:hypothetical protein